MRMLEEGGGGWLCERVKNKKLASNVHSIWTSCISSISHMHMSLLCARSVSPQQGCILGVWRVNRGSFFVSEWGTASFQPQPPLNGANQVMCCTASRYYMDVFSLSTGWIHYKVSFKTDAGSQSVLLLNCLTAKASFPQVENKTATFQQHYCDLWRVLVNLEPPL